jgi:hypothetical protein
VKTPPCGGYGKGKNGTFHHLIALFCTVAGKKSAARAAAPFFAMKSTT